MRHYQFGDNIRMSAQAYPNQLAQKEATSSEGDGLSRVRPTPGVRFSVGHSLAATNRRPQGPCDCRATHYSKNTFRPLKERHRESAKKTKTAGYVLQNSKYLYVDRVGIVY